MSLWLRQKDAEGRTHYIASGAGCWFMLAIPLVGILVALLLPLIQACRP